MNSTPNNNSSTSGRLDTANDHELTQISERTVGSLRCVSANMRKTSENHSLLLEQNRDADIIFVQEPFKGLIKIVASTTLPDGERYYHISAHRNFMCLGYTKDTRVLFYVNNRWRSASPQLRSSIIKHNDVVCITMRIPGKQEDVSFINVYNDSKTFAAVTYLLDQVELLPKIAVMAGDFNLRDPLWDVVERLPGVASRHLAKREELLELARE